MSHLQCDSTPEQPQPWPPHVIQSGAALGSPAPVQTATRAKILIVDDEPDIVLSLSKRLHFAGYEVASARDGVEATRVAVKTKPDVVILDIGMPCGDGHVVADRIRNLPDTMFAQIIFLTARVSAAEREKAMNSGAYGYLTKPFKSEVLLEMIERALQDSRF